MGQGRTAHADSAADRKKPQGTQGIMSTRFVLGSSAVYLAVMIVERLAAIAMVPLMTRVLSPADYGVVLLISNGAAWMTLIFGFSLGQAVPTLVANAGSIDRRHVVFSTTTTAVVLSLAVTYLLVAMAATPLSRHFLGTPDFAATLVLGAISAFVAGCIAIAASVLRLSEQHVTYAKVQIPALLVQTLLIAGFLIATPMGVNSPFLGTAIVGIGILVIYGRTLGAALSGPFDPSVLASAARIGLQMLPWQVATVLATSSAGFVLTRQGFIEDAGLFIVASAVASLIVTISNGFENVWIPFVLVRKDTVDLSQLQTRMFGLYSSGLLVSAAALSLFAHEVFALLAGPAFRQGYLLVPPLVLAFSVFGFANAFSQGLQARQSTRHYAWIGALVALVFFGAVGPLVARFGAFGMAMAMLACFSAMLLALQAMSQHVMPVPYPWYRHGAMWLIAITLVAALHRIGLGWTVAALKLAALGLIAALPLLFGFIRAGDIPGGIRRLRGMAS